MQEIADVYARSLFEVAREGGVLDRVRDELGEFVDELDRNRELQIFLFSPYFSSEEKKLGIAKLVSGAEERFMRFLELLAERHRMPVVFRVRRAFDALWARENKQLSAAVTSAVELDPATLAAIGERIEQQTGRRVELAAEVDPDLLGGLIVRVGNMVLDASVRNRLERLRKTVASAA